MALTDGQSVVVGVAAALAATAVGGCSQSSTKVMTNGDSVFTIAGGPIKVHAIVSECITANDGTATTMQWQHNPTVGSAKTISAASAALTSLAAGGTVRLNQTSLATAPDVVRAANGGVQIGANVGNHMTLGAGVVKLVVGTGPTTGTWRHSMLYEPMAPNTTVTAA